MRVTFAPSVNEPKNAGVRGTSLLV